MQPLKPIEKSPHAVMMADVIMYVVHAIKNVKNSPAHLNRVCFTYKV